MKQVKKKKKNAGWRSILVNLAVSRSKKPR